MTVNTLLSKIKDYGTISIIISFISKCMFGSACLCMHTHTYINRKVSSLYFSVFY